MFGQFNDLTIARALRIEDKLNALHEILEGRVTETNLTVLDDDWTIEERCQEALNYWKLEGLDLTQPMHTLSGGQKTKVFLAGISIHQPEIVLLDEPSNHLDTQGRYLLYDFIESGSSILVVVSHDRKLLNLLDSVYELSKRGITIYGGNYDFYAAQKQVESNALDQDLKSKEKALRKAKAIERETVERKQKLDARGKKKQEKAGVPTIAMNTLRNNAEKSTARIKDVHTEKIGAIAQDLSALRAALPGTDKMKFGFDNAVCNKGKSYLPQRKSTLNTAKACFGNNLSFQITSGARIALKGLNGSGKTTLIKIILGELEPKTGAIYSARQPSGLH